jgi:hypothetical protein
MYKNNKVPETRKYEWECIGTYTDIEIAIAEMDKLQSGFLGHGGEFKIAREGKEITA